MSDDTPPFAYEGLDPEPKPKSTISEVSDALKGATNRVSGAIETGRNPGMPLSILSNIAREAPLGRYWPRSYWAWHLLGADDGTGSRDLALCERSAGRTTSASRYACGLMMESPPETGTRFVCALR
jgi:hypothetical protein